MKKNHFLITNKELDELASNVLDHALRIGADEAAVDVSEGVGQNVSVRKGETETIEFSRDKGLDVTVYLGSKTGNASTSDLSQNALKRTVEAAVTIASFAEADEFAGLPPSSLLARNSKDLDLYHPIDLDVESALEMAKECESSAFSLGKGVTNSEGAAVTGHHNQFVHANTLGFMDGYATSNYSISCAIIAGSGDDMQKDAFLVGETAGKRALRRLGARKIGTKNVPVLFESGVASSLLGHFVSATSGGALYRKQSFLVDGLGAQIFPDFINIYDEAKIPSGLASSPFDDEGVETQDRKVVAEGTLAGYFLSTYSAKKLGMTSTGNAGGNHNLRLTGKGEDFQELVERMHCGFLVTDLLGMGVNGLTGDYSRGAAGFWVDQGEVKFPVEEVTIAGNLKEMFKGILAVGKDILPRGSRQCGSILIDNMTVAGN